MKKAIAGFDRRMSQLQGENTALQAENERLRDAIEAVMPYHTHLPSPVLNKLHRALQKGDASHD